jgi:segregation and condensation protein B
MSIPDEHLRMAEALLFAASEPLDEKSLLARLPDGVDLPAVLAELSERYAGRGVNLVHIGGRWSFRSAADLRHVLEQHVTHPRRLSRAAKETLAIVAYHQPVTRAEIEEIRGVAVSKGTLDALFEAGWIRPRGRRRTPGRPATYGTTDDFLEHFGLESLSALPGLDELKATGLLRSQPPAPLLREAEERAHREAVEAGDEEEADSVVPLKRPQI